MNQNLWGPHLWFFLHTVTFNYPIKPTKEDKERVLSFLYSVQPVIPCKVCRTHFKRNLSETPPNLESRKKFVEWMIDVHNEVNGRTGKKLLSYKEAINMHERKLGKKIKIEDGDQIKSCSCNYDPKNILLYVSIFLSLLLIINYYKRI